MALKRAKRRIPKVKKRGRPHIYTEQLANELCEWLAGGKPLSQWCKLPGKPNYTTVMAWLWRESDYREEFSLKYARAREQQAEYWVDQIIEISDDDTGDVVVKTDKKGRKFKAIDYENIARSRLKVDTRKWAMSKLRPKKYGDTTNLKLSDPDDGPVTLRVIYEPAKKVSDEDKESGI